VPDRSDEAGNVLNIESVRLEAFVLQVRRPSVAAAAAARVRADNELIGVFPAIAVGVQWRAGAPDWPRRQLQRQDQSSAYQSCCT